MDLRENGIGSKGDKCKEVTTPDTDQPFTICTGCSDYCRTTCTTRSSLGVLIHGEIPTCRADLDCMRRGLFCQSPCLSAGKMSRKSRPFSDAIIGVNGCFCTPRSNHSRACGLVPLLRNRIPHNTRVHRSLR